MSVGSCPRTQRYRNGPLSQEIPPATCELDSDLRPGIGSRRPEPWHYRGFAAARNLPLQTPHPGSLRPEPAEVVTAGSQNQEVMVFSGLG